MLDLIRKRHSGPGWIVVPEVGNSTGANVARHADAVAIGIWPSRGYEIHGFENKASRTDVKKELGDVTKADAVGKFCDYWWLVVEDLAIIDGLAIPGTWGILYPKGGVLRVHRKAPKRKATPIHRGFLAAIVRRVVDDWVPKDEHEKFRANAKEEVRKELERERGFKQDVHKMRADQLEAKMERFKEASGIDLLETNVWECEDIGKAVRDVMNVRRDLRHTDRAPQHILQGEIQSMEQSIRRHHSAVASLESAIERVKYGIESIESERHTSRVVVGDGDSETRPTADSGTSAHPIDS